MQHWHMSNRADPRALPLANAHYNRQSPDSPQFVPPGSCLVLLTEDASALWVTSAPKAEYVKHAWAGAWVNSLFRNEGAVLSSDLIREAIAATRWHYGEPPVLGLVTFIDPKYVKPKWNGRCHEYGTSYLAAGFKFVGFTVGGLIALQLDAAAMPEPIAPMGAQMRMEAA